jgi:hypothetical protein
MVSVGNVAQLAVDLFILEFGLERVAVLSAEHLISVAGAREANGEKGVTTPLECMSLLRSAISN